MRGLLHYFRQVFSIDLRALSTLRVGTGLAILIDLFWRAQDLQLWMTDIGVVPRGAFVEKFMDAAQVSVHLSNGLLWFQAFLFFIQAVAALALIFGIHTRRVTILSWFLLISMHSRNPVILQGGDVLLRLICFWGIFLPWGARYSVDSAFDENDRTRVDHNYFSVATIAFILQLVFVYVFAALLKSAPEWQSEFSAVSYALNIDQFATPVAKFIRQFPDFMRAATVTTYWIEAVGWLLWFSPIFFVPFRILGVIVFIGMHLGFRSCLDVGPFTWVSILSFIPLLPSVVWNSFKTRSDFRIYFDGECAFCRKLTYLMRTFLILPQAQIISAQSATEMAARMKSENSWIVATTSGDLLYRWDALIYVASQSPLHLGWLFKSVKIFGNRFYIWIANHRSTFGFLTQCISIKSYQFQLSKFEKVAVVFFTGYVFWWNIGTVSPALKMPQSLQTVGGVFRVDQYWNMFAPYPLKDDGWYVIPGKLKNGTEIDLFRDGAPVSFDRPENIAGTYKTERWRKYMMNLWAKKYSNYRLYFAQYLCRQWNEKHSGDDSLMSLQLIFNLEALLPEGQRSPPQRMVLWNHDCFSTPIAGQTPKN